MFIFVTLLPITLYGILLYNKSSEIIQDKVNLSISEALTQISTSINEKIENNHDTGKHTYRDTRIEQRYFTSYLHYDSPFNEIP